MNPSRVRVLPCSQANIIATINSPIFYLFLSFSLLSFLLGFSPRIGCQKVLQCYMCSCVKKIVQFIPQPMLPPCYIMVAKGGIFKSCLWFWYLDIMLMGGQPERWHEKGRKDNPMCALFNATCWHLSGWPKYHALVKI